MSEKEKADLAWKRFAELIDNSKIPTLAVQRKWAKMATESTQKKAALERQNKYYFIRG